MAALLPAFFACHTPVTKKQEKPVQIDTMELVAPPVSQATRVASNEVSVAKTDSTTYIRFGSSYLALDWIVPTPAKNDFEYHPDTIYFTLQAPHTIEGQLLTITTSGNTRLDVAQRYETSVIIDGPPSRILHQWHHFTSNWEKLKPEADNFYVLRKYSREERQQFPDVDIAELKQYTYKHLNREYHLRLSTLTTFPSPPCSVIISRYYLRITGMLQHSSEAIDKLIVIDLPSKL